MAAKSTKPRIDYAAPPLREEGPGGIFGMLGWLFIGYIVLLPIATAIISAGHQITQDRARFHVVNAITLTGFQSIKPISNFPVHAQVTMFILTLVGILFSMIVGGVCARRVLGMEWSDRKVVEFSFAAVGVMIVVGAIPLIGAGRSPFNALMLSASSFGNSGLYFEPSQDLSSVQSHDLFPTLLSWQTHLVLLPLAFIGALGVPVLMDVWGVVRRRGKLSLNSRVVLGFAGGLYLLFFVVFLAARCFTLWDVLKRSDGPLLLASSSAQAINARTLGFPFEYARDFPAVMQWLLMIAMVIGGGPASTAGGIKSTTIFELFRGSRRALRGENPGPSFGVAVTWVGIYAGMALLCLLPLIATTPEMRPDQLFFMTVSALSNVGLSHTAVQVVTPSLDFLTIAMLVGRLAPLMVLWWQARVVSPGQGAAGQAPPYENVAIG
jgi:Trk-type K+ transport system membrane component